VTVLRLFIAVDLPAAQRQAVAALNTRDLAGARFAKPEQLHVTLRFLGATPEERLPDLRKRLALVKAPRFRLGLAGAGVFPPDGRHPKVLWLGLAPTEPLFALKRELDRVLDALPELYPDEPNRPFRPHLTLARFSRRPDPSLARFLQRNAGFRGEEWDVEELHLYRSTLRPSGAVHELLAAYPFGEICRQR
jgi:RNA 2',3'-cyclic 3'-phosphodiesterase